MNFKSISGFLALVCFSSLAQAATITTVSPTYGSGGDMILLQGSGFVFPPGTNIVKFGSYYSPYTHAGSTVTLQVKVPFTAPVGSVVQISVSTDGVNFAENPTDFTVIGPGPYVASLTPNSGAAGTSVAIAGAHFLGNSPQSDIRVWFNGVPATITGYGDLQLQCTAPAAVSTGPVTVGRVGFGTNTSTALFYVTPAVTNFSPAFGRAGTNVTIRGKNLTGATNVYFNGISALIVSNTANEVVTIVPANATTGRVWVRTPATNYTTSTSRFVVQPLITSFTPNYGRAGSNVTVYGENLWGATNVWFGGVKNTAALSGISYGQLTVKVPAGATNGYVKVGTTNGTFTSSQLFHLPPVIGSFTPTNGPEDTMVTIVGTNFLAETLAVTFNGASAKAVYITNNNTIGAVVPPNVISGPIYVTTPAGTTNSLTKWFYGAPIIYSFSPTHGLPGTNVTIYGTNFSQVNSVKFNGTNAAFTSNTNGTITAIVPTNAYTGPISVAALGGETPSVDPFIVDYSSDLSVIISAPDYVLLGTDYTYVITITNRGPNAAPSVVLTNLLPGEVTLKSASRSQGSLVTSGNPVTGALGSINAFSKATVTLTVTPQVVGVVGNTATAASGFPDPNPADNTSTANVTIYVVPQLSIQTSSNQVQLSWSVNLPDYILQSTSDLTSSNSWANVATEPDFVGTQKVVTETIGSGPKFYRLKR